MSGGTFQETTREPQIDDGYFDRSKTRGTLVDQKGRNGIRTR